MLLGVVVCGLYTEAGVLDAPGRCHSLVYGRMMIVFCMCRAL